VKATGGTLLERFQECCQRQPGAPAFTFLDAHLRPRTYDYATLLAQAATIAGPLRELHLGRAAPVGLLLTSQEAQTLHYLAALAAGVVPAILTPPNRKLNKQYYAETMTAVLRRCQFAALITDVDGLEVVTPVLAPFTLAPRTRAASVPNPVPAADGPDLEASFLQFSSGTTGIKRGVLVPDAAVLAQLDAYAGALGLRSDDRILSWLPLYHDMGFIACLNLPLAHGVHCLMIDPIDWVTNPGLFLRAASAHRATLAWNPNFAYAFMAQRVREADLAGLELASLRGLVNCAEPVSHASQQQFLERFRPCGLSDRVFWGCYAMAETTFALTHGTPDDPAYLDEIGPAESAGANHRRVQVSVGRPLPGVELGVFGDNGAPLPDRHLGELWVKSPFNLQGYYHDSDATAKAFCQGWYRTGDLGYRVGSAFYVSGRQKDLLIVGGVNVFPQDLEDLVSHVEGVQPGRVAAFSTFDAALQTERVTILAESPHHGPDAHLLAMTIRQRALAAFQIANFEVHLVPPEWLVKSSSGKMSRAASRRKWTEKASTT
jgi:acyl-CoA synthetase (AMP-forming)/AMP-acid ligase II